MSVIRCWLTFAHSPRCHLDLGAEKECWPLVLRRWMLMRTRDGGRLQRLCDAYLQVLQGGSRGENDRWRRCRSDHADHQAAPMTHNVIGLCVLYGSASDADQIMQTIKQLQ